MTIFLGEEEEEMAEEEEMVEEEIIEEDEEGEGEEDFYWRSGDTAGDIVGDTSGDTAGNTSGDAAGYCRRSGDQGIGIQEILVGEFHVRGYKTQLTFA